VPKTTKSFYSINRDMQQLEDSESNKGSFGGGTARPLLGLGHIDKYASD